MNDADRKLADEQRAVFGTVAACVQRVAFASERDTGPTLAQAIEAVELPMSHTDRKMWIQVIAVLAARVDRLESGVDRNAVLLVEQFRSVLRRYDEVKERESSSQPLVPVTVEDDTLFGDAA